METSLTRHCKAIAARAANSTAFRFNTGKAPGSPRHTGHTLEFGGSPKRVEHEQKIFDAVNSWTWTSSPITGSYFASTSSETAGVGVISGDYKPPWRVERRAPRPAHGGTAASGCPAERSSAVRRRCRYFRFVVAGALKYFSSGISKYISSLPFASCTPMR